ncbi:MAG: recombination mediator RecR, partial [Beijerinckiaceae bacterium]|nr:recombination mediator RecR [Beijerinckiaceae bacterium]
IVTCRICGNADSRDPCTLCSDERRDRGTLVVVETVADLWALERASVLNAPYHVLGGTLSPLDGIGPKELNLASLTDRVAAGHVKEVILAVSATVDGQATAHYISNQLADLEVKITRLAHGVPVGGELDYLDEGTLSAAIRSRTVF